MNKEEDLRLQIDGQLRKQIDEMSSKLGRSVHSMPIRQDVQRPSVEVQVETQTLRTGEEGGGSRTKSPSLGDSPKPDAPLVRLWVTTNGALTQYDFVATLV